MAYLPITAADVTHFASTADCAPEAVLKLCRTDGARELIADVWNIAEVWDDAIDGDHNEDAGTVNAAWESALFGLTASPFMRNYPHVRDFLFVAATNWQCANALEQHGSRDALAHSYNLRCAYFDFFVAVVLLDAGPDAAREAAMRLRFAIKADPFDDYLTEHTKES